MKAMTFAKRNDKDHEYVLTNPFSTEEKDGKKELKVESPIEKREQKDEVKIKLGRPGRGSK